MIWVGRHFILTVLLRARRQITRLCDGSFLASDSGLLLRLCGSATLLTGQSGLVGIFLFGGLLLRVFFLFLG